VTNTLAIDLDVTFSAAPIITSSLSDPEKIHDKLSLIYSDGSEMDYDTYLFNDEGVLANRSQFSSFASNSGYKNELLKWNFEEDVTCSEFEGRDIRIVFSPKMAIQAGLIQ